MQDIVATSVASEQSERFARYKRQNNKVSLITGYMDHYNSHGK